MARIEQSIDINVPVHTAYNQLTQFEQYPRFVQDVEQVRQVDDKRLHLHTKAGNLDMEWDAEITQQVPDRCIVWRNTNGPQYEGRIELQPIREDGTRVTVTMECDPRQQILAQHGNAETAIAQHAEHDLARFKKFIERLGRGAEAHPHLSDAKNTRPAAATEEVPGETMGKAIGQTERERREAAGSRPQAKPGARSEAQPQTGPQPEPQREPQAEPRQAAGSERTSEAQPAWMAGIFQLWDEPLHMMRRISEDMEQFLGRFTAMPAQASHLRAALRGAADGAWTPTVETAQRKNHFVVCAELAGVRREDVQVEVSSERLTIEGDRRQEPPHEPHEVRSSERSYGHFYREIALPPGANPDGATAAMHDGMLEITVPVTPTGRKGRRLDIDNAGKRQ